MMGNMAAQTTHQAYDLPPDSAWETSVGEQEAVENSTTLFHCLIHQTYRVLRDSTPFVSDGTLAHCIVVMGLNAGETISEGASKIEYFNLLQV